MKLAEAREIIELNIKEAGRQMPPDCKRALELAVEAMKRVEAYRDYGGEPAGELLPGESEDDHHEA